MGDAAVVLLAAGLDEAVRAFGWLATAVLYAFAASAVIIVFWLFVLAG
jgi:hypothetical protein